MAYPTTPVVPSTSLSPIDGSKATYAASITGLVAVASATDIFTITGSASKIVRITRLRISGIKATASADVDIQLIKRSAANTSGTSTAPAIIPYDSLSSPATAVVAAYTANPTVGNAVGTLAVDSLFVAVTTAQTGILDHNFGNRPAQALVLRSAAEVIAVNLNGVTVGGGAFDIWCEFTEE
jgi:hypothetical protein